jgi:acetylornithine aminotransferase
LPNTGHIAFNDIADLKKKTDATTLAIILEFIQGEGGVNIVSREFVAELKALREQYGFLLIADEIQSGAGRTGKFFAFEHFDIRPDIVVMAKIIGGGLPLGALLGNERVADIFTPGTHGTTFGGNPVSCAAGIAVFDEIMEQGLMAKAERIGSYFLEKAGELQKRFPALINDVRGKGCMIGIELTRPAEPIVEELRNRGLLVNSLDECERLMNELTFVLSSLPS